VVNSHPGEGGIDSFLAIGAAKNDFEVRSNALSLFEDLPAGFPGQRDVQQNHIKIIDMCSEQIHCGRSVVRFYHVKAFLAGDAFFVSQALGECTMPVHLHVALDGEQALQILGESDFKPDLIILDLNIPKISGYEVLASYHLKKTPIVVFTASENEEDVGRALLLGAKEFVHKPMELQDYKTTVCRMVQKWAAPKDSGAAVTLWQ
jgi:CheY-like chemotaxis protein